VSKWRIKQDVIDKFNDLVIEIGKGHVIHFYSGSVDTSAYHASHSAETENGERLALFVRKGQAIICLNLSGYWCEVII
jgi:hypothetical protein